MHTYRASRFWASNLNGAALGGLGSGVLLIVVSLVVLWKGERDTPVVVFSISMIVFVIFGVWYMFTSGLLLRLPYEVEVQVGAGLRLRAPFKELLIPADNVRDIRFSFFNQGHVVRLRRRQGGIRFFVIHWFWGRTRQELVREIERMIHRI